MSTPQTPEAPAEQAPAEPVVDTFTRVRLTEDDLRAVADLPVGHGDRTVLYSSVWSGYRSLHALTITEVRSALRGGGLVVYGRTPDQTPTWVRLSEARLYRCAEQ